MIDYWRSRSRDGRLPVRAAVDPIEFYDLLPQVFVWGRSASGIYPVRLAGGFVADLHGRDLRQQNGLGLFAERDRLRVKAALEEARRRPEPVVLTAEAATQAGASMPLEVLFAPLAGGGGPDRFLGLYQPLAPAAWLRGQPVHTLSVRSLVSAGPANEEAPRLRLAALDGRRIA